MIGLHHQVRIWFMSSHIARTRNVACFAALIMSILDRPQGGWQRLHFRHSRFASRFPHDLLPKVLVVTVIAMSMGLDGR